MSTKHNTKHPERGRSNYAGGSSSKMASLEDLRRTQGSRERQTGSPWPEPHATDEERLRFIRTGRKVPDKLKRAA